MNKFEILSIVNKLLATSLQSEKTLFTGVKFSYFGNNFSYFGNYHYDHENVKLS